MTRPRHLHARASGALLASLALFSSLVLAGCDNHAATSTDAGPSEPSPNASILPAPLATGLEPAQSGVRDAGTGAADAEVEPPLPEWEREDVALPEDLEELHDLSGLTLSARFRWPDLTPPPRLPEANGEALERVKSKVAFAASIELALAGRFRFVLASPAYVLPEGTEFRARTSRFGNVVVWPSQSRYAVVQSGALRAVLNERRADSQPLTRAPASSTGQGQVLGFPTDRSRFTTSFGRLDLEQAHVPGSGAGGVLLCRFLLEIASIHPDAPACEVDLVPVRAEYAWTGAGRLLFEVTSVARTPLLGADALTIPPRGAAHRVGELPEAPSPLLADRTELRSLRNKPVAAADTKDAGTPKEGLLAVNGGDLMTYVLVDGVPVVHLGPHGSEVLLDLIPGSYAVAARDFLGDEVSPANVLSIPARFVVSEAPKSEP